MPDKDEKECINLQMYEWEEIMLKECVEKTGLDEDILLNLLTTFLLSEMTAVFDGIPSMLGSIQVSLMRKRVGSAESEVKKND